MKRIPLIIFLLNVSCQAYDSNTRYLEYCYKALESVLDSYERTITFFEPSTAKADLTFLIAQEHQSVCIITPQETTHSLLTLCKMKTLHNVILLDHVFNNDDIHHMGECEHLDVAYISHSIFEHNEQWRDTINASLTLGDYIFIETPHENHELFEPISFYVHQKGGKKIATPPSKLLNHAGNIYLFTMHKKSIIKRRWLYDGAYKIGEYTVESSFTEKKLIKQKMKPLGFSITPWHPGINLFTFKRLDGSWPTKKMIRKLLVPLSTITHNDLRIFNLIIQGNTLVPIDCNENGRRHTAKELLPAILNQFRSNNLCLSELYELSCDNLEELDNAVYYQD